MCSLGNIYQNADFIFNCNPLNEQYTLTDANLVQLFIKYLMEFDKYCGGRKTFH